jgi:AhpD family alkylhydroperoxidase
MAARLSYGKAFPEGIHALMNLGKVINSSGLEESLLGLVYTRASLLNGCAFCIDMHTKDARAAGETEQRLYALSAWRETPFFTPRERAALAWTERSPTSSRAMPEMRSTLRCGASSMSRSWCGSRLPSPKSTPGTGSPSPSAPSQAFISLRLAYPPEHALPGR